MTARKKILIVDDDPNSLLLLKTILTKSGFNVVAVSGGKEALKAVDEPDAPRMIICDWMMPSVDGIEVLKYVRQKKESDYTYFILLTAKVQAEDLIMGINAGADDYLTKPFNKNELLARINSGLRILELHENLLAKSETIKDFAYALTHDLKTPLLALNMTMQQAHDGTYGEMPDRYKTILTKSIDNIRLLLDMCESLLSMANYDQGDLKLDIEPVNLKSLLDECCESLEPLMRAKNIKLDPAPGKGSIKIDGDRKEIFRLLFNLVSNAIKYTPQGGQIKTHYKELEDSIEVGIGDSGPGIPEDELPTIFERFHKNKHGRRTIGTGLGLYLCKLITDLHHGKIEYRASSLGGSEFLVSLPR
ncbi:MAG: response regulator [Candidatus Obscuribacterales bacterium]|nr:response regulator [Candidatus Obscuribacterales bacterium]